MVATESTRGPPRASRYECNLPASHAATDASNARRNVLPSKAYRTSSSPAFYLKCSSHSSTGLTLSGISLPPSGTDSTCEGCAEWFCRIRNSVFAYPASDSPPEAANPEYRGARPGVDPCVARRWQSRSADQLEFRLQPGALSGPIVRSHRPRYANI